MLLNEAKKEVNEANITSVLKSVGVAVDVAKIKSLIGALDGVNIEEVVKTANIGVMQPQATQEVASASESKTVQKEEKKEVAPQVDASAGLGSLF